jgi:hypothetical protein
MDRVRQLSQTQQREREKGEENGHNLASKVLRGELPGPFMGVKARRFASFRMAVQADYLDVESHSFLSDILSKRGTNLSFVLVLIFVKSSPFVSSTNSKKK